MKIEIIQNPSGSFAIYNGDTLLSDGWRTKDDAEMQAAGHARRIAAAALGSAKTPAKAAAARENGRKGGRPVYSVARIHKAFFVDGGRFQVTSSVGHLVEVTLHSGEWDGWVKEWPEAWGDEEEWPEHLRDRRTREAVSRAVAAAKRTDEAKAFFAAK